jgi:hypothetical protein
MESVDAHEDQSSKGWIILVALFYLAWTIRATLLYPIDRSIESEAMATLYSQTVRIALWIVPVFLYLKLADSVSPLRYLKLTTRPRRLIECAMLIAAYFTSMWALENLMAGRSLFQLRSVNEIISLKTLLLPLAPIAEEIFFRGFVLRKLGERISFWKANLTTSLLFVLIHWPNWLYTGGFQMGRVRDSAAIFLLGCFLGFLVRRTDSLWPAITAHSLNNFIAMFLR